MSTLCTAIIVAAGAGTRMGFDKLAAPLAGQPVLFHTISAFLTAETISSLVIVGPPSRRDLLAGLLKTAGKSITFVSGGATRAASVSRGLEVIPADAAFIAVHDGARPLITPAEIDRAVLHARAIGATALARRVTETLKRSDEKNICTGSVDRENLWIMETPQVFPAPLLRIAYENAIVTQDRDITDEVSALQRHGEPVHFLESRAPNPKITVPADLSLAAALLAPSP